MRRVFVLSLVLVLCFGLAPNATANHTTDACHSSALIATETIGTTCPLILQCPTGSAICAWDLNVTADGIGYVRGRVVNLENGLTVSTCGPGFLNCSNTTPFFLPPTSVVNMECSLLGGETHPALLASLTCAATAAGHIA